MIPAPVDTLFDEILEFLASSPATQDILDYQPPEHLQQRLSELLAKNRGAGLDSGEKTELDEFLRMNRFMSRLKLKARKKLNP